MLELLFLKQSSMLDICQGKNSLELVRSSIQQCQKRGQGVMVPSPFMGSIGVFYSFPELFS